MAKPFPKITAKLPSIARITIPPKPGTSNEWRCLECAKLLGVRHGARLHVRLQGYVYLANLPVEAICRNCGAHNRT